jgi:hypothetical protein
METEGMPEIVVPSQDAELERDSEMTQESAPETIALAESINTPETPEEKRLSSETESFAERLRGLSRKDTKAEQILAEWERGTIALMQEASDRERLGFRIDLQRARLYVVMGDILGAIGLLEAILIEVNDMPDFLNRAQDLIGRAYDSLDYLKGK